MLATLVNQVPPPGTAATPTPPGPTPPPPFNLSNMPMPPPLGIGGQNPFQFTSSIDPATGQETYVASTMVGDLDMGMAAPERKSLDGPIEPNPWPKLKHLALWSMPATKMDVVRLMKTVAPTLNSLDMRKVYFNGSKTSSEPGQLASVPTIDTGHGTNDIEDLDEEPTPVIEPFDEVENAEPSALAEKDEWYGTIETMADVLRLKSCTIIFGKTDKKRLEAKLEAQVEGLADSGVVLDVVVSDYLVKGNGMGLSLFVAEAVKERLEMAKGKDKVEDEVRYDLEPGWNGFYVDKSDDDGYDDILDAVPEADAKVPLMSSDGPT